MSSISKQLPAIGVAGRNSSCTETRMVLLGRTGSGKISTANSILGRKVFDSRVSSSSFTQRCRRASGEFRGRHLTLLDTPGLLDTHQTSQEVQRELRRSVSLLYPGPHVFLLVIQIGIFTQEEKEVVRQLGNHVLSFCVVVFTHGDLLEEGKSVQQCLIDEHRDLSELVSACGGRYCIFNNHSSKEEQVSELLALVDSTVQRNKGNFCSIKMLQRAEEDLAQELQEEKRLLDEKQEMLKKKQEAAIKELHEERIRQESKREMEELKRRHEQEKEEVKLARDREGAFRREMEENEKKKERKMQVAVRVMQIRREEEERREALQENLDELTKTLEEQAEWDEKIRRAMEEKIQKDGAEYVKKERERELQQLQKERAIKQREEMKRDNLQQELDRLTQSLEDQRKKEEDRKKQMENLLKREREENQRAIDIQMENQRAEKRRTMALQRELKLVRMKLEQQKTSEEILKRQLEESLQRERVRCDEEMSALKKKCDKKCSELCDEAIRKMSAERQSAVTTVTGYLQEMGLLGLNAALESVGASCCIQ